MRSAFIVSSREKMFARCCPHVFKTETQYCGKINRKHEEHKINNFVFSQKRKCLSKKSQPCNENKATF